MIATVHCADVGPVGVARTLTRSLTPGRIPGLRDAQPALFAPLALAGPPPVGRAGLLALWDDEDAVDRFVESDATAFRLASGVHLRLTPLRAHGSWPGLPEDIPRSRAVPHDGPVAVLTLGRLRISQAVRFLRASRPAERRAVDDDGMIWASAAVRPPFVATVSIWRSSSAAAAYAYGQQRPAHGEAIAAQHRKDFHKRSAFIRFAITRVEGGLDGPNPVPTSEILAEASP
jgi:hypothetical protein